jgi:CRP-like cAMP-binding protein
MLARRGLVLYLLSGAVLRTRPDVGGRRVDLMLARDAIRMDDEDSARWRVLSSEPARVALMTPATVTALAAIPGAAQALMLALLGQIELELELRSIVGIQRIEERIVAFFRLLARRVGQGGAAGVRIPLSLEQKRIEEILSAGHTQATGAFRALFAAGVLVHDSAGWLFVPEVWQPRRSSVPNFGLASLGSGPNSIALITLSLLPL